LVSKQQAEMSARETILAGIMANQPLGQELPVIDVSAVIQYESNLSQFKTVLESIGGKAVEINGWTALQDMMQSDLAQGKRVVNAIAEIGSIDPTLAILEAAELATVQRAYVKGGIAVAENGSIWLDEAAMINRLLPFIAEHLVIVIEAKNIVSTMHHAYQQVSSFDTGFGMFLAGPSKTADIEQSLVIGAHGARSLLVCIIP
jgi:L-lactate dehydrogenase complex protein LldG